MTAQQNHDAGAVSNARTPGHAESLSVAYPGTGGNHPASLRKFR
jgi:hypothetical protein